MDITAGGTVSSTNSADAPVAVFVGGTSGIGQGMVEVFAEQTQGKSHIIIVGRNRAAAERILDDLAKPSTPSTTFSATTPSEHADAANSPYIREFVECDATLIKNVDRATKEILARHEKINYLVVSCGFSALGGRDETSEGIDKKLAVHYYARWKFIGDLLPALERTRGEGGEATVMSVMAASYGGEIDCNDLGLKKAYSAPRAALVAPTYNDLMMEASGGYHITAQLFTDINLQSYAAKSPSLTFIHAHPGFVRTNYMSSSRSPILRALSPLFLSSYSPVGLLMRTMSTSQIQTGEYMWNAIRETTKAHPGTWRTGARGNDLGMKRYYGNDAQRETLWTHTEQEMKRALVSKSDLEE